jgi:hypothetical protein
MDKFLYFSQGDGLNAASEAACYPVSSFKGFSIPASDNTSLQLTFISSVTNSSAATEVDTVDLTITAGSIKKVIGSIVSAINGDSFNDSLPGFIVIADQDNSIFIDSDITNVEISHDS